MQQFVVSRTWHIRMRLNRNRNVETHPSLIATPSTDRPVLGRNRGQSLAEQSKQKYKLYPLLTVPGSSRRLCLDHHRSHYTSARPLLLVTSTSLGGPLLDGHFDPAVLVESCDALIELDLSIIFEAVDDCTVEHVSRH